MSKLIAIGEALIDFTSIESGYLVKEAPAFIPNVGGAPANVCAAFSALGETSYMIACLGEDSFGDKICAYLEDANVHTKYITKTKDAPTRLVFVAIDANGERDFNFLNGITADMVLNKDCIKKTWFYDADILHFCSVNLIAPSAKEAHLAAIEYAKENQMIVSFDPNVRLQLWKDEEKLRSTILEFIPYANILKISSDELEFITGTTDIMNALPSLFVGSVELVLYTLGDKGSYAFTKQNKAYVESLTDLNVVDTTGAGDAFIGAFLYGLARNQVRVSEIKNLSSKQLEKNLSFANYYSGLSIEAKGSIASYKKYEQIIDKLEEIKNENI